MDEADARSPAILRQLLSPAQSIAVGNLFPSCEKYRQLLSEHGACYPELGHKLVLRLRKLTNEDGDGCRGRFSEHARDCDPRELRGALEQAGLDHLQVFKELRFRIA